MRTAPAVAVALRRRFAIGPPDAASAASACREPRWSARSVSRPWAQATFRALVPMPRGAVRGRPRPAHAAGVTGTDTEKPDS